MSTSKYAVADNIDLATVLQVPLQLIVIGTQCNFITRYDRQFNSRNTKHTTRSNLEKPQN